ncbi:acyltransferase family protein [Streptomyces sp. NPDC052396]|uniref:acyltransferase family protein n=1 Tax=Streptomyces sp. NPDC052396 TaxID=3365689 RepID=UPI0037CED4F8
MSSTTMAQAAASVPAQDPGTGRPRDTGAAGQRDPFFDNAKYLAIVLVALGHSWEPLTDSSRAAMALYLTVYAFHMPAFILISGYFSRGFDLGPAKLKRLVSGVLVPYLIFQVLYVAFQRWLEPDARPDAFSLVNPWYLNWFLAALFLWRLTTPIWQLVRWPVAVSFAIAVVAACTRDVGSDFDLMRVLQFLPFFVIGLRLRPEHFALVRRGWVRIAAVPVFAAAVGAAYWLAPRLDSGWLYHNSSVQDLHQPAWVAPFSTLALFLTAAVLTIAFLAWVPRRRTWFTALGGGTLYGYLLHGFLIKASRWYEWYDAAAWIRRPVGELVVTVLGIAMVTALCSAPVRRVLRPLMEPRMDWAFRRTD